MKPNKVIMNIIKDLKNLLMKELGDNINSVILFGSRLKGINPPDSDYDIVIVLKNDFDWRYEKRLSKIIYKFELRRNILVDFHLISLNQLRNSIKGKDPLFFKAINYGMAA